MVGVLLIFVGVTLVLNALASWKSWDKKNLFLLNIFTGFLIILVNVYTLITTTDATKYVSCLGGLLFGLTNLFVAFDHLYNTQTKGFGLFAFFATITAYAISGYYIHHLATLQAIMWAVWALIWLFAAIANLFTNKFKNAANIMCITQGILTTFIFGFLIVFQIINFV